MSDHPRPKTCTWRRHPRGESYRYLPSCQNDWETETDIEDYDICWHCRRELVIGEDMTEERKVTPLKFDGPRLLRTDDGFWWELDDGLRSIPEDLYKALLHYAEADA